MAGYSARQSSFTTGDTITAAHSNDEFNQVLAAFHATTGHTHDGTAGEGGPIGTLRDADSNNKVLIDSTNNHLEFYVEVSSSATQQLRIQDGAIVPITDNDIDLGTSSLEFKDLYVDGTAYVDAINYNGTAIASTAAELNIVDGDTSATSTTVADADRVVLNDGGTMKQVAVTDLAAYFDDEITAMPNVTSVGTLTTLTVDDITINGSTISDSGDFTIDGGADIILDADGGDVFFKDGGTTFGSATNTSGNLIIKSGTTTALTFSGADVTVAGDLTVSGDDITMGTNTAGNLLIADGTNFNSIAAGSLSEISTVADDDVFIAVDTSGGGLKKIARSTIVSGLATSSAISNVVDDSTPQLGGDLDVNSNSLVSTSNGNIALTPNGTGVVRLDGNVDIQTGLIDLKNGGTVSKIKFYCESSNAHAQTLQSAPHSAASSAVLVLPTASGTLIGTGDTGTLPLASIDIDGGTDIGAAIVDADLFIIDDGAGGTNRKVTASRLKTYAQTGVSSAADDITAGDAAVTISTSSGNITIDATANDSDIIFKGTDATADITMLTLDGSDAGSATFNHDIILGNNSFVQFGDAGENIAGDGTDLTVTSSNDVTVDAAGSIFLSADGNGLVDFKDGGTTYLRVSESSNATILKSFISDGDFIIKGNDGGVDTTALTFDMSDAGAATFNDKVTIGDGKLVLNSTAVTSTAAELNLLDGVSGLVQADLTKLAAIDSTAAELNIVDGGTSATSTTVADADRVVLNDNGTMVQVAMTDIKTYIGGGTSWQAVKTSNFTAAAGQGVFCNTTSSAFTLTLPAGSIGDEVSFVDYAGTFDTNNLTIASNGSEKIHGSTDNLTISVERAANTLVFTDSTQGWLLKSK